MEIITHIIEDINTKTAITLSIYVVAIVLMAPFVNRKLRERYDAKRHAKGLGNHVSTYSMMMIVTHIKRTKRSAIFKGAYLSMGCLSMINFIISAWIYWDVYFGSAVFGTMSSAVIETCLFAIAGMLMGFWLYRNEKREHQKDLVVLNEMADHLGIEGKLTEKKVVASFFSKATE